MNTILTDDEIDRQIHDNTGDASPWSKPLAFHQFARALEAAVLAKLREQEPVAWQRRMRPTWGNREALWGPWEDCTEGQFKDCQRVPNLHDWEYQSRALYAAPQPAVVQVPQAGGPAGSGGWEAHAKSMERELNYWRQRAQTMYEHKQGQCWYWQGDGDDHPESMCNSLPVVIRADALRAMLAAPEPPAQAPKKHMIAKRDPATGSLVGEYVEAPAQAVVQVPLSSWAKGIGLAVIGRRHFGNPIPQEWYSAARELLELAAAHLRRLVAENEELRRGHATLGALWAQARERDETKDALLRQAADIADRLDGWLKVRHWPGLMPDEKELVAAIRQQLDQKTT